MSYNVVLSSSFKKSVKYLKKRFPKVKEDLRLAIKQLLNDPKLGMVIPQGGGARKLRVRNTDLQKGKSAGYRLIYYVSSEPSPTIYLLLLYAKSDKTNVLSKELKQLLDEVVNGSDVK